MGYKIEEDKKILALDTETTGLSKTEDEILQLSIIDGAGEVMFNSLIRPVRHSEWPGAERVNQISPEMVKDAPAFEEILPKVQEIVSDADVITGYNVGFDLGFLEANGVVISHETERADTMQYHDGHRVKLAIACEDFGYDWGKDRAHDSLADTKAALYVYHQSRAAMLRRQARLEACYVKLNTGSPLMNVYRNFVHDMELEGAETSRDNQLGRFADWLKDTYPCYAGRSQQERLALADGLLDAVEIEKKRDEPER